jgi:glutamyl/glutaminyl-tRNA synthetase
VDAEGVPVLREAGERLRALEEWSAAAATAALKEAGAAVGVRGRALYVPVRQALTGADHGPPLGAILAAQGRERALGHLDRALSTSTDPV